MVYYWFSLIVTLDFFQIDDFYFHWCFEFYIRKSKTDIDYDVMNKIPNNGDNVEKKSLNWPCVLVFEMNNTLTCV